MKSANAILPFTVTLNLFQGPFCLSWSGCDEGVE